MKREEKLRLSTGSSDIATSMFSSAQQAVLTQVAVTLCHVDAGMPQYFLYFIEAAARVDQKTGKAVAKIMQAYIR